jgi:NAD(P)H-hydrate repair Nnr-like enzyme with NAD(P)H-hydrate epimerase domain
MNTLLMAKLEEKIQEWADDNCESDAWPRWTGMDTILLMTEAARAVFDAVMEAQEYAIREGFLSKA